MKIHTLNGYIQNIFIIEYPEKILIFDSGCRCDNELILNFVEKELKRDLSHIKLVAVSHIHPDHAGGANKLRKKLNVKIAAPRGINNWYAGVTGLKDYVIDILLTYYVAYKKKQSFRNVISGRKIKVDHYLKAGRDLPGFDDWKVLSTPGHTDCDLSFWHVKSNTIYIGDCVIKVRGNYIHPHPITYPKLYKSTLRKLIDGNYSTFLLAHGGENKIEKNAIDEIIKSTSDSPTTNQDILQQVLGNYHKKKKRS